jgi:beta-lactamase class A
MSKKMAFSSAALVATFAAGVLTTYFLHPHTSLTGSLTLVSCDTVYDLLNPWLRCEPEQNLLRKREFSDFKAGLLQRIDSIVQEGRAEHISIYLRDLEFGPWMGINESEEYSAASLLKSAVLLAVLKYAEAHPGTLQQRIEITPELISTYAQNFQPERGIQAGSVYTVDQLLEYMIVYSDNDATNALHSYLDTVSPDEPLFLISMEELGLIGRYRLNDDSLTVKQASSLFRQLYNISYLNKDMSQKALGLLLRSTFKSGIVAGVPAGTMVAHKFGERRLEDDTRQLHDCGIVYHPGGDYLLCIMTRGRDSQQLTTVIADISRTIYEEMTHRQNAAL